MAIDTELGFFELNMSTQRPQCVSGQDHKRARNIFDNYPTRGLSIVGLACLALLKDLHNPETRESVILAFQKRERKQ